MLKYIYGTTASGKTTLALEEILKHEDENVIYINNEETFDSILHRLIRMSNEAVIVEGNTITMPKRRLVIDVIEELYPRITINYDIDMVVVDVNYGQIILELKTSTMSTLIRTKQVNY